MSVNNRILRYLLGRFGNAPQNGDNQLAQVALTDRGMRAIDLYVAKARKQANDDAPIQAMVRTEGWQIIERELTDEIRELAAAALRNMASPDPALREQAMIDSLIIKVLNEKVLRRVNRRLLDAMLVRDLIESMETMKREHTELRKQEVS